MPRAHGAKRVTAVHEKSVNGVAHANGMESLTGTPVAI